MKDAHARLLLALTVPKDERVRFKNCGSVNTSVMQRTKGEKETPTTKTIANYQKSALFSSLVSLKPSGLCSYKTDTGGMEGKADPN